MPSTYGLISIVTAARMAVVQSPISIVWSTIILIRVRLIVIISVIPSMTLIICTSGDFYPDTWATEGDVLSVARDSGSNSHSTNKA